MNDPIALNARKQALKDYVRQQSAAEYRGCPFFTVSRQPAGLEQPASLVFALPPALNTRIFTLAAASAMHRQALFSACLKYLAYLHCRETEGVLAWALNVPRNEGTPAGQHLLPALWRFAETDLAQPVKCLFGAELAGWKQVAELTADLPPEAAQGELSPLSKVLVAYSETGDPFDTVAPTDYLLGIGIQARPEGTSLRLHFPGKPVDDGLAALLAERFMLLLQSMVFEPGAALRSMPWLPELEQQRIAALSAPVPAGPLPFQNVAQAIAASLRDRPARPFLECGEHAVTFADLAHYTNRLLNDSAWPQWADMGHCVLIVGLKGVETTLAALACMRIGKPFCLQAHNQPESQLDSVMALHQTRVVLLEADCRDMAGFFQARDCQVIVLPRYDTCLPTEVPTAPAAWLESGEASKPDDTLCVVMTSGSEGKPKGCIASHRALLNLAQEKRALYGSARSRVASMANHAFDYFVLECVEAMMLDITLVLVPEEARIDALKCVHFLSEHQIDQVFVTTVLAEDIMAQGDILSLKQLFFGGESLRSFQKHNYQLFHVYGPSETGVLTTWAPIYHNGQRISIGKPFGGYQCAVVFSGTVELCPIGVAGELLIGGVGVGLGYFNRPDLTAKAFIELDNGSLQGRFYRSGDICSWNVDSELEIQGRRDRQLKVNGFRVELDTIEKCLRELPGIAQAAVIGLTDQRGHAILGALVAADDASLTEQAVRDALVSRMPTYMVPGRIALVAALPLTRNGKLDRRQFKTLLDDTVASEVVPPQGATQHWLAACWARHLELDAATVSVDRSFFALGGHSLRAARMLADLRQALGAEVSLLEFFRHDNIAGLAQLVDSRLADPASAHILSFQSLLTTLPATSPARGPLSAQEARLYAQYRLYPESRAYLLEMDIPLPAGVTDESVTRALEALLSRHDILRTRYRVDHDGDPYAEVLPSVPVGQVLLARDDWQRLRTRAFMLEQGPLLRAYFEGDPADRCLRLQIHHILVDEPATVTLRDEFERLLRQEPLPPVDRGYRHYAAALAEARRLPLWTSAQAFWMAYLEGLEFDPFGHGAVEAGGTMASIDWQLTSDELAGATRLCAMLNLSPAVFFLALWGLVVAREGSSDAFSVSVANAHGARQGLDTIGMFVSLVPCAFRLGQNGQTFDEYVRQLADDQWAVMDKLFFPVEEVFLLLERDPRRFGNNPLLNIAYSYLESRNVETAGQPMGGVEAQGPLSLAVNQGKHACGLALEYQCAAFSAAQIDAIAASYRALLQHVLAQPPANWRVDTWLGAGQAWQPAQRQASYSQIDAILRQNFLTLGNQPAVIDDAGEVTWHEFAALTAAYARRLNTHAIRRALIMGPTGRQMQAFLAACFLTRTTYLALESGTPEARVDEVLRHAGPDLVIDTCRETITPDPLDWQAFASVKRSDDNPIAWILYSSGTTGKPKGICVAAKTVAQYVNSLTERLQLQTGLRVTQQFSPSFDGYLEEVLLAWALKGTSLVADRYSLLDERKARAFLTSRRPDVISAAPALLAAWNRMPNLEPLPKVCISGGDFLAPGDIGQLRQHMQIWNSYGPTETCIAASMVDCSQAAAGTVLPIGSPFAHVAFSVVSPEGRRLRPGQWGELLIYGDFAQHNYLDDPGQTAARFGQDENGPFFRTGDMAMAGRDGLFYLKGRMDDSCKVRGNFIGLGELEGKAGQYPGVMAAGAAVAWAGTAEACLVLALEGEAGNLAGLQQHLARYYTRSHLPSAVFPVERLPRTDTGKLDRPGVVALFHAWRERARPAVEEESLGEDLRTLIACWRQCLDYQGPLTEDSDFFLVSGSSLSAVRLARHIEIRFDVAFSPVDVFRNSTVGGQWTLIEARLRMSGTPPGPVVEERFLSADQPATPKLVLLPPAMGSLQELQALAERWSGRVTTSALTLAPEAAAGLSAPELEAALLEALQRILTADDDRPLWLGGYSLGAEMLAALLERHPSLSKGVDRLIFLDPNLQTRVFDGAGLFREFMDFFRDFNREAGLAAAREVADEADLRERFPALYGEWRHYRLQHAFLSGRSFLARTRTLASLEPELALLLSADAQDVAALPHELWEQGIVRQLPGSHVGFLRLLEPDVLIRPTTGQEIEPGWGQGAATQLLEQGETQL
ncbi:AMP-binding protein [Massilia violaceinigra]|nr:AMP-binding protein [Massilia violaceinigra]